VPNIDSWEFRLFGKKWHNLDAPRHISFPNAYHARQLAEELSMNYEGEESVPFANGFGGSIPAVITGRFRPLMFLLTLPISLPLTWLFPSGNRAYRLSLGNGLSGTVPESFGHCSQKQNANQEL
jgi:hypothetical protein